MEGSHNENRKIPFKLKFARMDILGTTLFLGTICCLILALQWGGQTLPWKSSKVIGLFVGFGLLATVFGIVQWKRGENAIIPLRILKQRSIFAGSTFLLFFGMLNYVVRPNNALVCTQRITDDSSKYSFFLPFYFQGVQGVSATSSGVRIIPLVASQITVVIMTGAIVTRWGYYVCKILGPNHPKTNKPGLRFPT